MPICPPEFTRATDSLAPVLHDLPARLIAIDGRDGAGKTTLGRYLAWYFNVTLVESDLFVLPDSGLDYRLEEIRRIVDMRLSKPRPVIVEGINVLELLRRIGRRADFHIYMRNSEFAGSDILAGIMENYERVHSPEASANLILDVSH